jgi:MtN3 and saliva related transmembrane protein
METSTLLGFVAGLLTTVAFVPQFARIVRTRSARDISLPAFATFTVGVLLWTVYGILVREPPIILWNLVTLVLSAAILVMKIRLG